MKKLLITAVISLLAIHAFASTGPYIETNIGYSSTGTSNIDKTEKLIKSQSEHFGYNFNAGVMFLGLGVEAGYTRFADLKYHQGSSSDATDLYGLHLAIKSQHSIGPIFIMGKIGYGQLYRGTFKVSDISVDSKKTSGLYFGFGAGIKFMPMLSAVMQYQQIQGQGDMPDANMTTIGINYGF